MYKDCLPECNVTAFAQGRTGVRAYGSDAVVVDGTMYQGELSTCCQSDMCNNGKVFVLKLIKAYALTPIKATNFQ